MKTTLKETGIKYLILFLFMNIPIYVFSSNLIVHMDDISDQDSLAVCSNIDTITLVGMKGLSNGCFQYYSWSYSYETFISDTIFSDTLYLNPSYNSVVRFEGFLNRDLISKTICLVPLSLVTYHDVYFKYPLYCNETTRIVTNTNYTGTATYKWSPEIGLSDPNIGFPEVIADSIRTYYLKFTTKEGCVINDSVIIAIQPMKSPEICIVSLDSLNHNQIIWNKPVSSMIDSFYIYKESNVTDKYNLIATVDYNDYSYFVDKYSNPEVQSSKYLINYKDKCNIESGKSIPHKTMHLAINKGLGKTWNLIWEPYQGFTVSSYYIYRGSDTTKLEMIGSTSASSTQYSDLNPPDSTVYYQVEIIGPNDCNPFVGSKKKSIKYNTSRSNIVSNEVVSGINDFGTKNPIEIYPNPSSESIFIKFNYNQNQSKIIEVYNFQGKLIKRINLTSSLTEVDIRNFENGIYFLKAENDNKAVIGKFIKQ